MISKSHSKARARSWQWNKSSVASNDDLEISAVAPGTVCVSLKGEHDLHNYAELRSLLRGLIAKNPQVLVDVRDAEFIDSSILHSLVLADRQAQAAGHRFVLIHGTAPIVATALRLSGLLDSLETASSVEEAVVSC